VPPMYKMCATSGLPDFKPKILYFGNFFEGGSCNGRGWYISCPFGLFYGHLVC
jgi:hypothetical protein